MRKKAHTHTQLYFMYDLIAALDLVEGLREQHLSQQVLFVLLPVDHQATTGENEKQGLRGCLEKVTYQHHRR